MVTKDNVIDILKTVKDPEIWIDIWTIGLIRDITITKEKITILMTLTTPQCPYGPQLMDDIKQALTQGTKIKTIDLQLTFNPPWKPPEELRKILGV
ncbi:MAG TPA: metal-sulfur cluster assembly factor [Candidatus Nanoarchaeia archaeon]|nr:metal-sulfur cluster assembly factor [Candidatus Nanoarchaeia archaeon]